MAKQSEQILEEEFVAQSKAWLVILVNFNQLKALKINRIKNLTLKMFTKYKKGITFASTVPLLLPVRTAQGSFFFIGFAINLIHLFCLTLVNSDGVFTFNNLLQNG